MSKLESKHWERIGRSDQRKHDLKRKADEPSKKVEIETDHDEMTWNSSESVFAAEPITHPSLVSHFTRRQTALISCLLLAGIVTLVPIVVLHQHLILG